MLCRPQLGPRVPGHPRRRRRRPGAGWLGLPAPRHQQRPPPRLPAGPHRPGRLDVHHGHRLGHLRHRLPGPDRHLGGRGGQLRRPQPRPTRQEARTIPPQDEIPEARDLVAGNPTLEAQFPDDPTLAGPPARRPAQRRPRPGRRPAARGHRRDRRRLGAAERGRQADRRGRRRGVRLPRRRARHLRLLVGLRGARHLEPGRQGATSPTTPAGSTGRCSRSSGSSPGPWAPHAHRRRPGPAGHPPGAGPRRAPAHPRRRPGGPRGLGRHGPRPGLPAPAGRGHDHRSPASCSRCA